MSRGKWKPRRANGSVLEAFRHGRYNVRDQRGHYVSPESQADPRFMVRVGLRAPRALRRAAGRGERRGVIGLDLAPDRGAAAASWPGRRVAWPGVPLSQRGA